MYFLMIQGCLRQPSEDCKSEIEKEVLKMNEDGNLLTREKARQALLDMIAKDEAKYELIINRSKEENEVALKIWDEYRRKSKELLEMMVKEEAIRERIFKLWDEENNAGSKFWEQYEEYRRKEKELLEMTEYHEDVEQSLEELRAKRGEQLDNLSSRSSAVYVAYRENKLVENERGKKEWLETTKFNEDVDRDKLFEDYVVITITDSTHPERNGNWECDLKAGWFRKSTTHAYFGNTVHGRFGKNKTTGEWVARITSFSGGDRAF